MASNYIVKCSARNVTHLTMSRWCVQEQSFIVDGRLMKLYRLMCKAEYDMVDNTSPFSWQSKAKWFSDDIEFIKSMVSDGKFNNSCFVEECIIDNGGKLFDIWCDDYYVIMTLRTTIIS